MKVIKTRDYEETIYAKKGQLLTVTFNGNTIMQQTVKKDLRIDRCTIFEFSKKDELLGFKKGISVVFGEKSENS